MELIQASNGQELARTLSPTTTVSNPGQDEKTFRADLSAAQAMAQLRGVELTSLVLPRNQWNPAYERAVLDLGFNCIRGPQRSWGHRARQPGRTSLLPRAARLADSYVGRRASPDDGMERCRASRLASATCPPAHSCARTTPLASGSNLCGWLDCGQDCAMRRTMAASSTCGGTRTISRNTETENFAVLGQILDEFDRLAASDGMRSLTMADVVAEVSLTAPNRARHPG